VIDGTSVSDVVLASAAMDIDGHRVPVGPHLDFADEVFAARSDAPGRSTALRDVPHPMRASDAVDWNATAKRYADLVYSIPLKYRLHGHDAAEVFQNTWLVALSRERAPEDDGMAPWLAAIASLQSLSLLQKRRMSPLAPDEADVIEDVHERQPSDALVDAEEEQALRDALAELSERDRILITCLYLTDSPMKYTEISQRLGLAIGSIGALKQRAIDRLYKRLRRPAVA
jgi:RNA polymerase sigma factor (sigma-70 family)